MILGSRAMLRVFGLYYRAQEYPTGNGAQGYVFGKQELCYWEAVAMINFKEVCSSIPPFFYLAFL